MLSTGNSESEVGGLRCFVCKRCDAIFTHRNGSGGFVLSRY